MTAPTRGASGAWTALLLLSTGFLMSQAFRTIAAIMAAPLQAELQLSPQQLGVFAAAYHFAFGGLQLFMGMGIDLHGLRRTVLTASPLMALGAVTVIPDRWLLIAVVVHVVWWRKPEVV